MMKPVTATTNRRFALERLQRDLDFVVRNPVEGACMAPVDDDLFTWCGNVRLRDCTYHFTATFTVPYARFSRTKLRNLPCD